jgi:hypothetical protein
MLIVRGVLLDATWMRSDKRSPRVGDTRLPTDKDVQYHTDTCASTDATSAVRRTPTRVGERTVSLTTSRSQRPSEASEQCQNTSTGQPRADDGDDDKFSGGRRTPPQLAAHGRGVDEVEGESGAAAPAGASPTSAGLLHLHRCRCDAPIDSVETGG